MSNAEILTICARLTRKGARLIPCDGGYTVIVPGQRRQRETVAIAAALVVAAAEAGLIAAVEHGGFRLTEAGALALRRGAEPARPEPMTVAAPMVRDATATTSSSLSPLARLRQKRDAKGAPVLSSAQVEAGERLARDFLAGQMMPRVTANWDRARLGFAADKRSVFGASDIRDGAAAAQERVRRALDDAGPELAGLLVDVCCLEIGMEAVERQRQWPPRTARIVLGLALDRLMRHYGMVSTGPVSGRMSQWGDADYRPTLKRWTEDGAGA